ncbi:MAG: heme-binding protein [Rhodocyclaceae bacterium]
MHKSIRHCVTQLSLTCLSLAVIVPTSHAQTAPATPPAPARGPSLELALEAARTVVNSCLAIDQKIGVSVLDSAGVPRVVLAADGASPRGVQSGNAKALTTLAFKQPSGQLGEAIKTDKSLADKVAADSSYAPRAGGVLLKVGDEIVGAIGVGGARGSEKDEACALAGVQKIQARLK